MTSPILSVTGRASCPGFILAETQLISDVRSLSPGIENIYPNKATIMPPETVLDCLGGQMSIWTPQAPGWVRLSTFPYRGDLAFISRVDSRTLNATLVVVPCVDFTHPEDRKLPKSRKPPPQAFFNAPAVRACFGEEKVEKRNSYFLFDRKHFVDGFLETDSDETAIVPENATPTSEEIHWFYQCSMVPARWLESALHLIKSHTIQRGDRVKILVGDHRGTVAAITDIFDDETVQLEVSISLLSPKFSFKASIAEVRKHLSIGDEVIVTAGPHKEAAGWVIAAGESDVQIFNHKTCEHVRYTPSSSHCFPGADKN